MEGGTYFAVTLGLMLLGDLFLWLAGKETITRWHIKKVRQNEAVGKFLLFGWGALIGHLFLTLLFGINLSKILLWNFGAN